MVAQAAFWVQEGRARLVHNVIVVLGLSGSGRIRRPHATAAPGRHQEPWPGACDRTDGGDRERRLAQCCSGHRPPAQGTRHRAIATAEAAGAAPTIGVVPGTADEVSAPTVAQCAGHAQIYQAVSTQPAAIHKLFVTTPAIS